MGAARTAAAVMESRKARVVKRMITCCCCSKDQPREYQILREGVPRLGGWFMYCRTWVGSTGDFTCLGFHQHF
jgi:hypothetical protein